MTPIRVIVVEDQPLIRELLMESLATCPQIAVVGQAANGFGALKLTAEVQPDVVLMDVEMPHMDGIEATAFVRQKYPASQVLLLSTYADDAYVLNGIRAGAVGYVLKEIAKHELVTAIEAAAQGISVLQPTIATKLVQEIARPVPLPTPIPTFSEREQAVARLLIQDASNQQIADALQIAYGTVKTYVRAVMTKIDVHEREKVAARVAELGIDLDSY